MGARRYGISLRVFNSIAHELAQRVEHEPFTEKKSRFHQ